MKKSRFVWLYNFQLWTIETLRGDCRLPDRSQYFDVEQRPGVAAVMVVALAERHRLVILLP
jgi:hypothetical protein